MSALQKKNNINIVRELSKEDEKKEEIKKKFELMMKRQRRKETITVLAILSSVFLVAILLALLKGGERMVQQITGTSLAKAQEIYENTRNAVIGMGLISSIIMIIFIIQTIKEKKKNKQIKEKIAPFIDYDRLESARIRVERARKDAKKGDKSSRIRALENEDNEYLWKHKSRIPEGMSEEEYRRKRQEEYERYMRMDFADEEDADEDLYDADGEEVFDKKSNQSIFDSFGRFILNHGIILGIVAGAVILAIILLIVLL